MPVGISSVCARRERQRRVEAGAQVEARGARRGVVRQRKLRPMRGSRTRTCSARRTIGSFIAPPRCPGRARSAACPPARERSAISDDQRRGQLPLRRAAQFLLAARPVHGERVVLAVERQVVAHLVGGDHVEALALELGERVALDVLRLGREAHDERSRRARGDRRQDVGRARQRQRQRVAGLLDLLRRALHRAVVGDGRGRDEDVGAGQVLADGVHHLLGRLHVDASHARRRRDVDRSADEHHLGARLARGLGHGETHLAGAAVGDEAHRIDALARRARGDQHLEPRQRAGRRDPRGASALERSPRARASGRGRFRRRPGRPRRGRAPSRRASAAAPRWPGSPHWPTSAGSSPARR